MSEFGTYVIYIRQFYNRIIHGDFMNAISVRDLRKSYGDLEAVKGISFDVPEGSFFASSATIPEAWRCSARTSPTQR